MRKVIIGYHQERRNVREECKKNDMWSLTPENSVPLATLLFEFVGRGNLYQLKL